MTDSALNVKVGDKVIYTSSGGVCRITTVTKITPTGRIRVAISSAQYDKYGREMGNHSIWRSSYLSVCTPEVEERVVNDMLINKALHLAHKVQTLTVDQAKAIIEILEENKNE